MPKGMPNTYSYQCQPAIRSPPRPVHESTWTGGRPAHSILQSGCAVCWVAQPASSAIITSHLVIVQRLPRPHGESDNADSGGIDACRRGRMTSLRGPRPREPAPLIIPDLKALGMGLKSSPTACREG